MKGEGKGLLWIARGGMEFSWLYAWASFTMAAILHQPFPLTASMGAFILATLLSLFVRGRGWRIIFILLTQVIGFSFAVSGIVYAFADQHHPYFGYEWLMAFISRSRSLIEWIVLSVILCFAILFWISGVKLARRPDEHFAVCNRFDLGVAAFFGLFLFKFSIFIKGGIQVQDPVGEIAVFPFFIFSLMAIGIANNVSGVQKDFLPGFRVLGLSMTFAIVVLGFGAALVLLYLPYLTIAAEVGYGTLKTAVGPLGPVVTSFLLFIFRFMFGARRSIPDQASRPSEGEGYNVLPAEESWWIAFFGKIFAWSLAGIIVVVAVVFSCIGVWYLVRWLLSRSEPNCEKQNKPFLFLILIQRLKEIVYFVRQWITGTTRGYKNGAQFFVAATRWGRLSGIFHFANETPLEYGLRLKDGFPFLNREFEIIMNAFNQEIYGETPLSAEQFKTVQRAWRKLTSPRYWPLRIKSWFLRSAPGTYQTNVPISNINKLRI
jgi:hypothetical protein